MNGGHAPSTTHPPTQPPTRWIDPPTVGSLDVSARATATIASSISRHLDEHLKRIFGVRRFRRCAGCATTESHALPSFLFFTEFCRSISLPFCVGGNIQLHRRPNQASVDGSLLIDGHVQPISPSKHETRSFHEYQIRPIFFLPKNCQLAEKTHSMQEKPSNKKTKPLEPRGTQ